MSNSSQCMEPVINTYHRQCCRFSLVMWPRLLALSLLTIEPRMVNNSSTWFTPIITCLLVSSLDYKNCHTPLHSHTSVQQWARFEICKHFNHTCISNTRASIAIVQYTRTRRQSCGLAYKHNFKHVNILLWASWTPLVRACHLQWNEMNEIDLKSLGSQKG